MNLLNLMERNQLSSQEFLDKLPGLNHPVRKASKQSHHLRETALYRFALKQSNSGIELDKDTPKRPDVDFGGILAAKEQFRRSVRPRLHVEGWLVVDEAAASEIDQLDLALFDGLEEDVFRFEIAVHDVHVVEALQGSQNLSGDALDLVLGVVEGKVLGPSVLLEIVEVSLEELGDDEEVLSTVEVVVEGQEVVLLRVAVLVDESDHLDLFEGLVQEGLSTFDDLQTDLFFGFDVVGLLGW